MANVPGNAHMRLYNGTITGGRAYALFSAFISYAAIYFTSSWP